METGTGAPTTATAAAALNDEPGDPKLGFRDKLPPEVKMLEGSSPFKEFADPLEEVGGPLMEAKVPLAALLPRLL